MAVTKSSGAWLLAAGQAQQLPQQMARPVSEQQSRLQLDAALHHKPLLRVVRRHRRAVAGRPALAAAVVQLPLLGLWWQYHLQQ
jgi:hypothetical protein